MSSSSESSSAAAPSMSASNNSGLTSPLSSSQAALYLYTFLVTLVILLIICSGLILRTYMLRRWHRRMMEQGILNGTYIAPVRTPRKTAKRPCLHDVHLQFSSARDRVLEVGGVSEKGAESTVGGQASCWDDILPLSLWTTSATPKAGTVKSGHSVPTPGLWSWSRFGFRRPQESIGPTTPPVALTFSPQSPSSQYSTPPTPPSPATPTMADILEASEPEMDVAVLISMPHDTVRRQSLLTAPQRDVSAPSDLPPVEFGIARVRLETQREE